MTYKPDEKPFEGIMGDTSELRVLEHLLSLPKLDFNISELARSSRISRPSVHRAVRTLSDWGILKALPKRGNMTFYKINEESPIVESLYAFNDEITLRMFPELSHVTVRRSSARRTANTAGSRGHLIGNRHHLSPASVARKPERAEASLAPSTSRH